MLIPAGCVLVPPEAAEELAGLLRAAMAERMRVDGWQFSARALDTVAALEEAARLRREGRGVVAGVVELDPPRLSSATVEGVEVSVSEAARLRGVSRQAIQKRIGRTLAARREGREWRIALQDLSADQEERA